MTMTKLDDADQRPHRPALDPIKSGYKKDGCGKWLNARAQGPDNAR
jgi:hypothetical protein